MKKSASQKRRGWFARRTSARGEGGVWLHAAAAPRRADHTRRDRWIIALVAGVLLLVAGGLFHRFHFSRNRQFMLKDFSMTSGATISEGLVRELLARSQADGGRGGEKSAFLFGPDIAEVRSELLRIAPGIRTLTITRRLPARMDVRLVEREPVGQIGHNGQVVDEEGVIFSRSVGVEHLPRVDGMEGIPVNNGATLDGMGLAAVRLLTLLRRPENALPVVTVDISRKDYLFLILQDHRQVRLWWRGMDAASGNESREALGKRLRKLLIAMNMAPQRQVWDASVQDDSRIFSPY
jgi:cell division septal protein FtsQ